MKETPCVDFKRTMNDIIFMKNLFSSLFVMVFVLSCASAGVKNIEYVEFEKTSVVSKDFNDVWGYVIEWAAINSFPIENADKESGMLKLSGSGTVDQSFFQSVMIQGKGAQLDQSLVSCGEATGNIGLYGAKFSGLTINAVIILREVEDTTRVTVNLSGNAGVEVRNGYGVVSSSTNTCASRGIFEQKLFDDLSSF
jgi:hypothetical protein